MTSSLIASLSLGGGGQTKLSIMSSVAFFKVVMQSGASAKCYIYLLQTIRKYHKVSKYCPEMIEKISNGIIPVLADRIIMQSEISSCKTDSRNIISRSLTIAPFNTIISSPLMTPEIERCEFDTIILLNMFNCIYNRLL